MPGPAGTTRVAGLVGGPGQVSHSRSPAIHNAAYAATGLDWVYVGFPVAEGRVSEALRGLQAAGVAGVNVTMPHKLAAAAAVDRLEGLAAALGAVNTVQMLGGELVGWNTDGDGLAAFLRRSGVTLAGRSVLVIGSGGSARAVVAGLCAAGAATMTVLARDRRRAEALAPLAGPLAPLTGPVSPLTGPVSPLTGPVSPLTGPVSPLTGPVAFTGLAFPAVGSGDPGRGRALEDLVAAADLIVNATPVGQEGEPPLVPVAAIRPDAVVVDLVYHPSETPLVQAAARRGAQAFGGLGMLVHQAALAFEIFTGRPAPLDAMWAGARSGQP